MHAALERKMNNPSKLVRLTELNDNLNSVINFAYDDEETKTRGSFAGTAVKAGGLAGAGTAGLYGYGLTRRGVNAGPWGKGLYKAAGQDVRNVGSAMSSGRLPIAAATDIGSSIGAGARGVGQGVGMALSKLKTLLPAMRGLSSKEELVQMDEHILKPFSDGAVPHSKIIEEEFPAGLSPAAALKFPFPKLLRYLNRPAQLQQQFKGFSKREKLVELKSKLNGLLGT